MALAISHFGLKPGEAIASRLINKIEDVDQHIHINLFHFH